MTTVLPPLAYEAAHTTARIYPSTSMIRPYFYRGTHRRGWSDAAKITTLGTVLFAIASTAAVLGIQLFSTAW